MKSSELYERAMELMPGGVSSPVRAIRPYPFYTRAARGPGITTVDGDTLIDCCMAYGPLILGHAHPLIHEVLSSQLPKGWLKYEFNGMRYYIIPLDQDLKKAKPAIR